MRDGSEVEGLTRATRVWWTVSFNRYALEELLTEAQLPPLTGDEDDTRIDEMLEAELDANLSDFVEVVSRCAPLRGALGSAGRTGYDGEPVRRALCAVLSPGRPIPERDADPRPAFHARCIRGAPLLQEGAMNEEGRPSHRLTAKVIEREDALRAIIGGADGGREAQARDAALPEHARLHRAVALRACRHAWR